MGKPTVHDIAREAGVSLATVDRVMNARAGVRAKTVDRVNAAIAKLGYVRDLSAANLARQRAYRFGFVLPDGSGQFVDHLEDAIREASSAARHDRTEITVQRFAQRDPHAFLRALGEINPERFDGLALMAPETPQLRDAVARLRDKGVAVVTLVSDLPNSGRDHFVGINNVAAGRTAAVLMARFLPRPEGDVLVVSNSMQRRDSIERRLGFDQVLKEQYPGIVALPTLEGHDDPDRVARIMDNAFAAHPGIRGVYVMGSDAAPALRFLEGAGRAAKLNVIAHNLTARTRAGLETGALDAVITQDVGHMVRSALRLLRARADGLATIASQERIRIEIVLRENLP